jgi:Protein of unknown function (DUF2009)
MKRNVTKLIWLNLLHYIGEKSKEELQEELEIKSSNTQKIIKRYTSAIFSEQDIQRILDSISDQEAYLSFNVLPVEKAIQVLKETFNPQRPEEHYSLELKAKPRKDFLSFGGFSSRYINNSACLSHNHATQYTFVLQSLTLWKEIMWNLPKLWLYADQDLIGEQVFLSLTNSFSMSWYNYFHVLRSPFLSSFHSSFLTSSLSSLFFFPPSFAPPSDQLDPLPLTPPHCTLSST